MSEVETKGTEMKETETNETETSETNEKEKEQSANNIDVEAEKKKAVNAYLESLGVDNDELGNIVKKHKEEEEKNKTDLEKKNDELVKVMKELKKERELRLSAEAKVTAYTMGVKPELLDDFVVIAKSKVTSQNDIASVIAEMKDSPSGKVYFNSSEEEETEEEGKKNGNKTIVTSKRIETKKEKEGTENNKPKSDGSMAERLLKKRLEKKDSPYFKI